MVYYPVSYSGIFNDLSECMQPERRPDTGSEGVCSLMVKGASFGTLSDGHETVGELNVYQAADGIIYKTRSITPDGDGRADISVSGSNTTLYFLAGASAPRRRKMSLPRQSFARQ